MIVHPISYVVVLQLNPKMNFFPRTQIMFMQAKSRFDNMTY